MPSKLHERTREVLKEIFPACPIIEEYPIRVNGRTLFIDFFIDHPFNIAVECQGRQHTEYVSHFHRTQHGFFQYKRRDRDKEAWCFNHAIPIVYVYERDDITAEHLLRLIDEAQDAIDKEFNIS